MSINAFVAAGCVFMNNTHVLAGYQPNKPNPCISGIGGKREGDETYLDTAIREMIEEIFGIYNATSIIEQVKLIEVKMIIIRKTYIIVLYSFEDLVKIMEIVSKECVDTPMYDSIPLTIEDLIFKRRLCDAEISHLVILPVVSHPRDKPFVDGSFLKDLSVIIQELSTPSGLSGSFGLP